MGVITLSFKFTEFYFEVEHKHINDVGKFAIFCLRMLRDGFSINDISKITNIEQSLIENQLLFLKEQEYLTQEYKILDNATLVLSLYDLVNTVYNKKPVINLDHYIWNKENKELYTFDSSVDDLSLEVKGIELKPIIGSYKISSILEDIKSTNKFYDLLIDLFPNYTTLINENTDGFIFNFTPSDRSFYLNKDIPIEQIIELEYSPDSNIKIAFPFTEYKTSIKDDILYSKDELNWYNENKSTLNYSFCLLSGNMINNEHISELDISKHSIIPKTSPNLETLNKTIQIPLELFLNQKLDINHSECYYLKSMDDFYINSLIKE